MGRAGKEVEETVAGPSEVVLDRLAEVEAAFLQVGYPNPVLEALARLALEEYQSSDRALDRSKWFSSLLQVGKVCSGVRDSDSDEVVVGAAAVGDRQSTAPEAVLDVDMRGWE